MINEPHNFAVTSPISIKDPSNISENHTTLHAVSRMNVSMFESLALTDHSKFVPVDATSSMDNQGKSHRRSHNAVCC